MPIDTAKPLAETDAKTAGAGAPALGTARLWALIACAGNGARALAQGPKQYQPVAGQPLVLHTLAAFAGVTRLAATLVVVAPGDGFLAAQAAPPWLADCGGASRAASVLNGLQVLREQGAAETDWVLVHDAARCLVTPAEIDLLIDACQDDAVGGLLALALPDTLKRAQAGRVAQTLERGDKWLAQTPQMFRLGMLQTALRALGDAATDEASALEAQGLAPLLVAGSAHNFKVTYPHDFALAQAVLEARQAAARATVGLAEREEQTMQVRVGEGWDTHALVAGRKLVLGGVEVPFDKGLLGHSDADVLL
ncbi:MAG: 2-C-methyl-D-erythritol 4-phosphate cytidylyltransferase, partial [Rhodoferax sp.]